MPTIHPTQRRHRVLPVLLALLAACLGMAVSLAHAQSTPATVLLLGMGHDAAVERAESWRSTLAEMTILADGTALKLTASFGVATSPEQAGTLAELMKVADTRMYRAKSLGRDRVIGASAA